MEYVQIDEIFDKIFHTPSKQKYGRIIYLVSYDFLEIVYLKSILVLWESDFISYGHV